MFKKRLIYNDILNHLEKKEFTIITGARSTGKTTILLEIYKQLKTKKKNVWFVSFENEEILRSINQHPEKLFQFTDQPSSILEENQEYSERIIVLIDEIQYANNPSNFLKYLYDQYNPNLKIIATGSSAFYLDKKFKDSLAGRKRIFVLKTLNFEEYLIFKEKHTLINELHEIRNRDKYLSINYNKLLQLFDDFLNYGGYPAVVLSKSKEEKIEKLTELKNAYIKRDLTESGVNNETAFYSLMVLLSGQTGNMLNKNEYAKLLRIDNKTIENYIFILQKCFYISLVRPFYTNIKKELIKMPKIYFNDLGLRNILINRFYTIENREDKGQILENYTYIRLNELYSEDDIKFWRTTQQNEVDFIVTE
jgi:predicted AAA+ superfamily ATPase